MQGTRGPFKQKRSPCRGRERAAGHPGGSPVPRTQIPPALFQGWDPWPGAICALGRTPAGVTVTAERGSDRSGRLAGTKQLPRLLCSPACSPLASGTLRSL